MMTVRLVDVWPGFWAALLRYHARRSPHSGSGLLHLKKSFFLHFLAEKDGITFEYIDTNRTELAGPQGFAQWHSSIGILGYEKWHLLSRLRSALR